MRVRYENWVAGPGGRLADLAAAVLRGAVPGLVPGGRRRVRRTTRRRSCRSEDDAAGGPGRRARARVTPRRSAACPAGSSADPDVMDTWATSSLTPLIAGRWGTDDDLFARVFPMDLRPQSHEIIRTWLFSTVTRSHLEFGVAAVVGRGDLGLDPRPGPEEDVEVQGERGRPDRPARPVRLGRGAVLGGQRPVRGGHRVRPRAAQGRAAAGDQDTQRVEVRAVARGAGRAGHEAVDRSMLAALDDVVRRGDRRRWRPTTTPARSRRSSGSSGCSATTTWSW